MGTLVALVHAAPSAKEVVTWTHILHGRVRAMVSGVKAHLQVVSSPGRADVDDPLVPHAVPDEVFRRVPAGVGLWLEVLCMVPCQPIG